MLHILFLLLKILLCILLGILGLALLIVLLVLFAPVRYKVDADYHETAIVKAKVRYLFVSFTVFFNQSEKKLEQIIRIAGFKLGGNKDRGHKKKGHKRKNSEENQYNIDAVRNVTSEEEIDLPETKDIDQENNRTEDYSTEDNNIEENKEENSTVEIKEENNTVDNNKKTQKKRKGIKATRASVNGSEKLGEIKKKLEHFKRFWKLECTVKTRQYLKKYMIKTIKHIGPRRIQGYIRYGFEDPSQTGQITGYLSLMPFVYQKNFYLEPDFYNKIIEGKVKMRGRIVLGYLLRFALNTNIWKTIKVARKYL
ncbi:MAG: DUF2953 domain-containing protein [Wujia sp.]